MLRMSKNKSIIPAIENIATLKYSSFKHAYSTYKEDATTG